MNENKSYITIILILLIVIGLFLFLINIPKLFPIQKEEINKTQINEYLISLKYNNNLINGVVDIYIYNETIIEDSATKTREVRKDYIFLKSINVKNKSYSSEILEMNKTYCFKGRSYGYYSNKFCKFFPVISTNEKVDINLSKSSNITIYSENVINVGEDSIIINIINNDSLEYRDVGVCLEWSNNIVYSRINDVEEIKRIGYYQHCYKLNKSLNKDNRIIAFKLNYKINHLDSSDYIEIYVFDYDEGYNNYNDFFVYEMNKIDIAGANKIYKLTKYGNYLK